MDLFGKYFDVLVILFAGGGLTIMALQAFKAHRSILELLAWLSAGVAFIAQGLLALMGYIGPDWNAVFRTALAGIILTLTGITGLAAPPSPSFARWICWASLVIGVVFILFATVNAVEIYRR
jgi:hypothetical protein